MSVSTDKAGFIAPASKSSPRRFELRRIAARVIGGISWFAKLFSAVQAAVHQAERRHRMSEAQLQNIRLSLDPAADEPAREATRD